MWSPQWRKCSDQTASTVKESKLLCQCKSRAASACEECALIVKKQTAQVSLKNNSSKGRIRRLMKTLTSMETAPTWVKTYPTRKSIWESSLWAQLFPPKSSHQPTLSPSRLHRKASRCMATHLFRPLQKATRWTEILLPLHPQRLQLRLRQRHPQRHPRRRSRHHLPQVKVL